MTGPVDEIYDLDVPQDPHEPVWETDANIAEMTFVGSDDEYAGEVPPIRLSSDVLEFVNDIAETIFDIDEQGSDLPSGGKPKLDTVRTRELGSDRWRPGRRFVTASMSAPIVTNSPYRRKIWLTNYGPNVAYLSSLPSQAAAPNTIRLEVFGPTEPSPGRSSFDPAAGAEFTFTVPAGETWDLATFIITLVTDATVANRTVHVQIVDNNNVNIWEGVATVAQTASQTVKYSAGVGTQDYAAVRDGVLGLTLPDMTLLSGWKIRTVTTGIVAGDNYGLGVVTYLVSPTAAANGAAVCLTTRDDVWAYCAVGETATVEIYEEFDQEC